MEFLHNKIVIRENAVVSASGFGPGSFHIEWQTRFLRRTGYWGFRNYMKVVDYARAKTFSTEHNLKFPPTTSSKNV